MPIINCPLTCFDLAPGVRPSVVSAFRVAPIGAAGALVAAPSARTFPLPAASPQRAAEACSQEARCARRLFHYIHGTDAMTGKHPMNNLDLSRSQLRESRIKLHGPEA